MISIPLMNHLGCQTALTEDELILEVGRVRPLAEGFARRDKLAPLESWAAAVAWTYIFMGNPPMLELMNRIARTTIKSTYDPGPTCCKVKREERYKLPCPLLRYIVLRCILWQFGTSGVERSLADM